MIVPPHSLVKSTNPMTMLPSSQLCICDASECCQRIVFPFVLATTFILGYHSAHAGESFQAGAAIVDVSPVNFPVAVNGGMTANTANGINTPLNARSIVMSHDDKMFAIVVVDSCMMPRRLLDEVKAMAAAKTGIPTEAITISATHTHTAAASMSCLGTDADLEYVSYLRLKIVEAIESAKSNLQPAVIGWGSFDASNYMAVRRWIRRPDRVAADPFGNLTVRANMHAGRNWEDVTGESGPEDPEFSMIALQTLDQRPIAVLANLSMHYFSGVQPISADYFGMYCDMLQEQLKLVQKADTLTPVTIMSHGCSGDVWRMDYTKITPPRFESIKIEEYARELVEQTLEVYRRISFKTPDRLKTVERRIPLKYRTPNKQLLKWAEDIVFAMGDQLPKTTEEVYAREQLYLSEAGSTEVVVQAICIGDIAIATTPTETYALTGLKIKLQSPVRQTMVLDLANGGDGYIPPPEQHVLGGYNTWPARSAGLEPQAEPKIVATILELLEQASGVRRRPFHPIFGPASEALLKRKPLAYWKLHELSGPRVIDYSGHARDGFYEPGVVFFLEGTSEESYSGTDLSNRSAHFAGGRMLARVGMLPENYQITMWIWNGMPLGSRDVLGWFYGRGVEYSLPSGCEQLGIAGTGEDAGKLILNVGGYDRVVGRTPIARWTWQKVSVVRRGKIIQVFLQDASVPEIELAADIDPPTWADQLYFGGTSENQENWEGRLDEIAVFADEYADR